MRKRKFKLKISEFNITLEDKETIKLKYKHLADLKLKSSKVNKDEKDIINVFKKEIKTVRDDLANNYAHKFFKCTIMLGPHKEEETYPYYPSSDDITYLKETLTERLGKDRKQKKEIKKVYKNFNGIEYELEGTKGGRDSDESFGLIHTSFLSAVKPNPIMSNLKGGGNVFTKPGTIVKMTEGPGYAKRILKAKKPYDKAHYVGVEIELICKLDRSHLQDEFIKERLANHVYIKDDSSIRRDKEDPNGYTHEVTIIGKQDIINSVIKRVCAVLNSAVVGAYVNDSCGIHVHIDMRARNYGPCFNNFVQALPVLIAMVPSGRTQSEYCVPNRSTDPNSDQSRRQAINPQSFHSHKTIEVRLHSGSTNADKLNNWVNILTAIADCNKLVLSSIQTPEGMKEAFNVSDALVDYMKRRINKFASNKKLTTKDDHMDQSA